MFRDEVGIECSYKLISPNAEDYQQTFVYDVPKDLPNVVGNPDRTQQVLIALLDNAFKYTPEGGDILLRTGRNEKGHSFFLVQDEGIGISPDDTPHIFERFFRSDPARSRESGGTGLGLSIAKWIIDRHGGYFQVLSREGIGTRITVCFPS